MSTLQLINKLIVMAKCKENPFKDINDAECILQKLRADVCNNVRTEIWNDITNPQTGFYAPEYNSWKEFLETQRKDDIDYAAVLQESFDEEELDVIWSFSHIEEDLDSFEIKKEMVVCIDQLKMLLLFSKENESIEKSRQERLEKSIRAKLTGLYNQLYEG